MTQPVGTNVQGDDRADVRSFALLTIWSDISAAVADEPQAMRTRPTVIDVRTWRASAAVRTGIPARLYRVAAESPEPRAETRKVSFLPAVHAEGAVAGAHGDIVPHNILLASAVDDLPAQERAVIALYYFERLPLKDIKTELNASDLGVSQIHARAVAHLRARLSPPAGNVTLEDILERVRAISPTSESIAIRNGLPATTWNALQLLGLGRDEIANVVGTSEKTVQRKVAMSETLGVAEGDRTMRLIRIIFHAFSAFGDADKAFAWLRRANRALHGQTPLGTMVTEAGAASVRRALGVIAYGGVA
jgi:putative toxin-antitoxin system antitoxin component (TIGR02293 family)